MSSVFVFLDSSTGEFYLFCFVFYGEEILMLSIINFHLFYINVHKVRDGHGFGFSSELELLESEVNRSIIQGYV